MSVLCKLSDLAEGRLTPAQHGKVPVLVTLLSGQPRAIAARCPHQRANLSAGCIVGRVESEPGGGLRVDPCRPVLRCPWHGFEYDLATGDPVVAAPEHRRMRLRSYPVQVVGDNVVITSQG